VPLASAGRHQREDCVDAEDEHAGDGGVGEVVVCGGHDRQQRDRRVQQRQVTPARPLDADEHHCDQQCPSEVQRRHRRELIGDRRIGVLAVDAGAIGLERVDETVLVEHPRRSQRIEHVDDECDQRHRDEPVAEPRVEVAVAEDDPTDECEAQREVDEDVVVVEELDQPVEPHRDVLDAVLAEDVQRLFDVDDAAGIGERRVGVVASQVADLLVAEEGGDDDDDLADGEPGAGGEAGGTWHRHVQIVERAT